MVRRLQEDMKFSAAGEKFKMKYVAQSLRDWKTWVSSMWSFPKMSNAESELLSGDLHGIVGA